MIQSADLEKGSLSPASGPAQDTPNNHTVCQILLELGQDWCFHRFSGEPAPVPSHPLGEKLFPHTQPKPALPQLHAVFSSTVIINWIGCFKAGK